MLVLYARYHKNCHFSRFKVSLKMGNRRNRLKKLKMSVDVKKDLNDSHVVSDPKTTSASKLCESESASDSDCDSSEDEFEVTGNGYRIWDWGQLQAMISSACVCKDCGGSVELVEDYAKRKGWCSQIGLLCTSPTCSSSFEYVSTSPVQNQCADVNTQCVLAMRSIGSGRSGASRFSSFMNMPSPITKGCWSTKTEQLSETVREIANENMLGACAELKQDSEDVKDVSVSLDGAWQTRGMTSHHGVVTASA